MHLSILLQPLPVLLVALGLAIGTICRRERCWVRYRTVLVCYGLLVVSSLPATAYLLMASLEGGYGEPFTSDKEPQAIVILAGYIGRPAPDSVEVVLGEDVLYRCLTGQRLAHRLPEVPIVVSGGLVRTHEYHVSHAELMQRFLVEQGLQDREVIAEKQSRTTYENAMHTAEILRARQISRVVVVTDGSHLWRSELCFRRQGIEVVGVGSRFYTHDFAWTPLAFVPSPHAMVRVHAAVHEWIGMAWYKLRGYL